MLQIADELRLPLEAVTQTFAILAKRGTGKTYTALVLAEEMLGAGQQVVLADPVGVTWGLRAAADGQGPGLPIVIFGGDHGDLPLHETAGKLLADVIVDEGIAAVLDLSLLRKGEQTRFMTDFAETLYHRNRAPLHLILDEADAFAPQRPLPGQQRLLGAIEDLVRRGRARGLGVTLVTQRAAVLNKDVLTQAEVLIALRTIAPQDRDAIDAWVKVHGTPEERQALMGSLPSLPIGTAWFWSPGWLDVFQQVQVRPRRTFDSSATPKVGTRSQAPSTLAPVHLDRLRDRLEAVEPQPTRGTQRTAPPVPERVIERVEVPVLDAALVERLETLLDELRSTGEQVADLAGALKAALIGAQHALAPDEYVRPSRAEPERATFHGAYSAKPSPATLAPTDDQAAKLPLAERKILAALAPYEQGRTMPQVAILAGYAASGGGFRNALGALRSKGWVVGDRSLIKVTPAGYAALGPYVPLPTGRKLLDYWEGRLGKAERTILRTLVDFGPSPLPYTDIAEITGYAQGGGGFRNALGRLRTLELIEGKAKLRANPMFFERS